MYFIYITVLKCLPTSDLTHDFVDMYCVSDTVYRLSGPFQIGKCMVCYIFDLHIYRKIIISYIVYQSRDWAAVNSSAINGRQLQTHSTD